MNARRGFIVSTILAMLLVVPLAVFANGTKESSSSSSASSSTPTFTKVSPPQGFAAAYQDSPIPVTTSAYAHWKASSPPFTVGFANSNMGNTWRAQSLADLRRQFARYKKQGVVSKLYVYNANNDVSTQISQINDLIAKHVDLILINAATETGLNPVIKKAYKAGIVVVAFNDIVSSPYAEDMEVSQPLYAVVLAKGLVKLLHGHGNIVMIEGIPGAAGSVNRQKAAKAVFNNYPGIHVVADVPGKWQESAAKTAMLQVLATHPQKINGVWQQGGMSTGVESAIQQSGRHLVPVTATGMWSGLQFWHAHKSTFKTVGSMDPPGGSSVALRMGIRILEGQHPVVNTVFLKPPVITQSNLSQYWKPGKKPTGWVDPPTYQYVPTSVLNKFYSNGKATLSR